MASSEEKLTRPSLSRNPSSALSASLSSMKSMFTASSRGRVVSGTSTPTSTVYSKPSSKPVSRTTSIPNSPELHGILARKARPDLAAVNRALSELKVSENPENKAFIQQMEVIQKELETNADSCRIRLQRAMEARSAGNYEICRGLCWEISTNGDADTKTRVYAYNILATLSDSIQARHWLEKSQKLVNQHLINDPELKKLNAIIAMLRQSRVAKQKDTIKVTVEEHEALELPRPAIPIGQLPASGMQTPDTEKIIQWARQTPLNTV
ncbi:hypothetical protein K431DRAFT_301852 [Polychaeton citri CBS 116435]|uniref:Uncharacterized protein n=1 Tax=Polychaeton citri CBS 116435 TaxID=1314669 RepID=A0A9P4USM8_9PEZI|nr:hypothetical protein K431DRAFT_301852 [Polychaeton citri CBS 116435]